MPNTHIPSEIRIYTQRGTRENQVEIATKLVLNVYIVGAQALGILSATSTVRNLPNPPTGVKTAYNKPPTDVLSWNPAFHAGTLGAAAANAAPRVCPVICNILVKLHGRSTTTETYACDQETEVSVNEDSCAAKCGQPCVTV
jgi:hypothetical protein